MAEQVIQRSFAGGEIARSVQGRADQTKYQTGLKTCRNFRVKKHGGVENRAGSQFVNEVKDSTTRTYGMKWVYNASQTYLIELGDRYMRFYRSGSRIVVSGVAAYNGATTYNIADLVVQGGVNYYCIAQTTGNAPPNATYWYPLTGVIYEIPTPYLAADLPLLKFVQSADTVTITHNSYAPRTLTRTGHTAWTLALKAFAPSIDRPTNCAGTAGGAGAITYRYRVTAVKSETYEESLPGRSATQAITGITQANPAVVTYAGADNFSNGEEIYIDGVSGMTQVNGGTYIVANVNAGANTFELQTTSKVNVNSTGYGAYTAGGTVALTFLKVAAAAAPTAAAPHVLTWDHVTGWGEYNVYRETTPGSGTYAFMAIASQNTFSDTNGITVDASTTPPIARNPFDAANKYPGCVSYYQQRQVFGKTTNEPEKVWTTRTGMFNNLTISSPLQSDDAVTFSIAGKQVNEIRHMAEIDAFVILTSGGEWVVLGDANGTLSADQPANLKNIGSNGASEVAPVTVGNSLVFVQARGTVIRDLRNEVQATGGATYSGRDLTVFAGHLFRKKTTERMDYAQTPDSIIWTVRSDGVMLGLTYLREHEIWGWHRHDTDGLYEDVVVVPEGDEDVLYVFVKRYIDGSWRRYIERFPTRDFTDIAVDAIFCDSYLSYDGRNTGSTTMSLSTGAGWTVDDTITITAAVGTPFVAGDVGNWFVLNIVDSDPESATYGEVTDTVTIDVTGYTNSTHVTGTPSKTVPTALRGVATTSWSRAVDQVSGLDHLNGKNVSVFADGNVVANPNNPSYEILKVDTGAISFDRCYSVIHVGLPFTSDFQTLDLDIQGAQIRGRAKDLTHITMLVENTRGIFAGARLPEDIPVGERQDETDMLEGMNEMHATPITEYGEPWPLENGNVEMNIPSTWNESGSFAVRQVDPLPITILSAIPNVEIGG